MKLFVTKPSFFSIDGALFYQEFVLAPVAALGFASAARVAGISFVGIALWVLAGIALWSFAEYVMHRCLHDVGPLKRMHDEHHAKPRAFIVIANWGLIAAAALTWFAVAGAAGKGAASAITAGVLFGYLFYILVHHRCHHADRRRFGGLMSFLERHHAIHHYRDGRANFGVSSPLWDIVFRTYRAR